ncbi:uncharacterized protein LOC143355876 [Halictus rubicundus]|uniref:uncharacterized protein LOC143355876 n=1 Tax=Halictus rubicundus TaxID=77578 RepID=UPI0040356458
MPRGKLLTSEEKASIDAYKDKGCSNRSIAKKINRSRTLIDNYINLGEEYGKKHPTGGNKKLTRRQYSLLMNNEACATDQQKFSRQITVLVLRVKIDPGTEVQGFSTKTNFCMYIFDLVVYMCLRVIKVVLLMQHFLNLKGMS